MSAMFEAKLRRIGNSVGVIIPGEVVKDNRLREGEMVRVVLPKRSLADRNRFILSIAGKYKGHKPFKRDKEDRY